jgi:flagellar biosynthetic protein FliR
VPLSLDIHWVSAFLLAMVRSTAWVFVAPPFNSSGIPQKVKLGLAFALALFVAPHFKADGVLTDPAAYLPAVFYQAAVGLAMGFGVLVLLSAAQAAGALIDFSAGFSSASTYDPLTNAGSTPFERFYQLMTITVLFASQGHAIIVRGFLMSFGSATGGTTTIEQAVRVLAHDFSTFAASSLQMAVPIMAALFVAEIGVGLVAKAVPAMNVISLGFTVKMGGAILMAAIAIQVLPAALYPLVQQAADTMMALGR